MRGHGRPSLTIQISIIATMFLCAVFGFNQDSNADNAIATESLPIAWQDDAELTDVFFLNPTIGWVVGAQGLILRTTDGGKTWLQSSDVAISAADQRANESLHELPLSEKLSRMQQGPRTRMTQRNVVADASRRDIRVRFESVHFVDAKHGWAAGGYQVPWMERSRALIMRTSDGGKTWRRAERLTLPRVNRIHFTSHRTGWAIGETNALHPDGIYFSNDGGANWSSQSTTKMKTWIDGRSAGGQFVLIGSDGQLSSVTGTVMQRPALFGCSRDDRINCLAMQDEQIGFAAGQGGLILKTVDGGNAWKRLPIEVGSFSSARAMAINGRSVFLAPADGGLIRIGLKDGVVQRTSVLTSVPIRKIQFVNPKHGFAVGDFGTILSTDDGGQTWRKQRGDHDRLAMLFVANRAEDISLSLMAFHAGEESRLCGTLVLDDKPDDRSVSTQAFERTGSVVNLRSDASETPNQKDALESAIRTLKPLVVVCCHDLTSSNRYRDAISLERLVHESIEWAADDDRSGDRPGQQGSWQVQRLVTADLAGSVRLDSRRMMPSLGLTVSDLVAVSRALLGQPIRGAKVSTWRVTHPGPDRRMRGNDFLSGLGRKGTPIPKRNRQTALGNLNRMGQALAKQKQTEQLIEMPIETNQDLIAWREKLLSVAATIDENLAGLWLADLAERYLAAGRFDMVDHSLDILTTYWSDHAFAPAANAWLTVKRSQQSSASESSTLSRGIQRRTLEPFMRLTQYDPSLVLDPAWQWLELNLLARSTSVRSVEPRLAQMSQHRSGNVNDAVFALAAREELALLRSGGETQSNSTTKNTANLLASTFATERPKLDGVLDDAVWVDARMKRNTIALDVVSDKSDLPHDELCFAHDDEFFYGAIRCQKLPSQSYRFRKGARTRDPDLSRHDRVELTIDPNLNFCGGIKLTADHRGWVAESKLAGKDWNPDWYVAGAQDEKTWIVEFAIPLAALSDRAPNQPVNDSDASPRGWAVRACRLNDRSQSLWESVPGLEEKVGLQASLKPDPRGFRRLIFDSNPDLATPQRDPHVQPAQFELELNEDSDPLPAPPQVPNIGVSNAGTP